MLNQTKNNPYYIELLLSLICYIITGSYKRNLTTRERQNLVNDYNLKNVTSSYLVTIFTPDNINKYNLSKTILNDLVCIISSLGYTSWVDFTQRENCELASRMPYRYKNDLDPQLKIEIDSKIEQRINELFPVTNKSNDILKLLDRLIGCYYSYWFSHYHNALVRNCAEIIKVGQNYIMKYITSSNKFNSNPIYLDSNSRILRIELLNPSGHITLLSKLPTDCDSWEIISSTYSCIDPNDFQPYSSIEIFSKKNERLEELKPTKIEDYNHLKQLQEDTNYEELALMWKSFNLLENQPLIPPVKLNTLSQFERYTNEKITD